MDKSLLSLIMESAITFLKAQGLTLLHPTDDCASPRNWQRDHRGIFDDEKDFSAYLEERKSRIASRSPVKETEQLGSILEVLQHSLPPNWALVQGHRRLRSLRTSLQDRKRSITSTLQPISNNLLGSSQSGVTWTGPQAIGRDLVSTPLARLGELSLLSGLWRYTDESADADDPEARYWMSMTTSRIQSYVTGLFFTSLVSDTAV